MKCSVDYDHKKILFILTVYMLDRGIGEGIYHAIIKDTEYVFSPPPPKELIKICSSPYKNCVSIDEWITPDSFDENYKEKAASDIWREYYIKTGAEEMIYDLSDFIDHSGPIYIELTPEECSDLKNEAASTHEHICTLDKL